MWKNEQKHKTWQFFQVNFLGSKNSIFLKIPHTWPGYLWMLDEFWRFKTKWSSYNNFDFTIHYRLKWHHEFVWSLSKSKQQLVIYLLLWRIWQQNCGYITWLRWLPWRRRHSLSWYTLQRRSFRKWTWQVTVFWNFQMKLFWKIKNTCL